GAAIVICNDYEIELMKQKTGLDEDGIVRHAGALIVTRGEHGCTVRQGATTTAVPAVAPRAIVDPTGVGDAFRGGLLKGIATGSTLEVACRLGGVAATYALEHLGGQSHSYTWDEFASRYATHFGPLEFLKPAAHYRSYTVRRLCAIAKRVFSGQKPPLAPGNPNCTARRRRFVVKV